MIWILVNNRNADKYWTMIPNLTCPTPHSVRIPLHIAKIALSYRFVPQWQAEMAAFTQKVSWGNFTQVKIGNTLGLPAGGISGLL